MPIFPVLALSYPLKLVSDEILVAWVKLCNESVYSGGVNCQGYAVHEKGNEVQSQDEL